VEARGRRGEGRPTRRRRLDSALYQADRPEAAGVVLPTEQAVLGSVDLGLPMLARLVVPVRNLPERLHGSRRVRVLTGVGTMKLLAAARCRLPLLPLVLLQRDGLQERDHRLGAPALGCSLRGLARARAGARWRRRRQALDEAARAVRPAPLLAVVLLDPLLPARDGLGVRRGKRWAGARWAGCEAGQALGWRTMGWV
jgi:hypothetical protein